MIKIYTRDDACIKVIILDVYWNSQTKYAFLLPK